MKLSSSSRVRVVSPKFTKPSYCLPSFVFLLFFAPPILDISRELSPLPLFSIMKVNKVAITLLTRFEVVKEQLVHPFISDTHLPPFFLQIYGSGLSYAGRLLNPVLNLISMKCTQNLPEEVAFWIPLVFFRPSRIWQVLSNVRKLHSLVVQVLNC